MSDPQPPLTNSRRHYEKRTYTPLVVDPPKAGEKTNTLGLSALVRTLMISVAEFGELARRLDGNAGQSAAVATMQSLTQAVSASAVLGAAAQLAVSVR